MVVGGERKSPSPGDLGAVAAAAPEDPDVEFGVLAGDDVCFGAVGAAVGPADQRQDVVDLFGVVGGLRVRLLEQR